MNKKIGIKQTEIGTIPEDWQIKELRDFYTISTGKTNSSDSVDDGPYPLFDRSSLIKKSTKYLFDCEAVIVPGEGEEFNPKYFKGKFDLHQRAYALFTSSTLINTKYVYFAIKALRHVLSAFAVGSTVKSLRQGILQKFKIPFPPIHEQIAIADNLSKLDFLIEINEQTSKILEEITRVLFVRWFMEFEFPDSSNKPYKSNGGMMTNSELGKVPQRWVTRTFNQVATMIRGFSYTGKEKDDLSGDYPFITLNNIKQGGGFKPDFSWISSNRLKDRYFLVENDLIIANTHFGVGGSNVARLLGCPGLVFFPYNYDKKIGVFSHHITKISPLNQNMKYYLYLFLKATHKETASIYHTGTSVSGLDTDNFMKNRFIIEPPEEILCKFNSIAVPIFSMLALNNKENMILKELRQILTPVLTLGKMRINPGRYRDEIPGI